MSTRPTIAILLSYLEHGAAMDACEAAKLLAEAKEKNLIDTLARILRSGRRSYSREAAAYALSWLKDRRAAEHLLRCGADPNEQDSVRGQAVEGLAIHLDSVSRKSGLRLKAQE